MFKVQRHYQRSEFEWNFFFKRISYIYFDRSEIRSLQWDNLEMRNASPNLHQMRNYDCVSRPELFWEEDYVHHLLYKAHKYQYMNILSEISRHKL